MDILHVINRVDEEKYDRRFLHGFNEKKIFSVVFRGHVATLCSHLQPSSRTKECFRVFQHLSASFFGVMQESRSVSLESGLLVAKNGYYIKEIFFPLTLQFLHRWTFKKEKKKKSKKFHSKRKTETCCILQQGSFFGVWLEASDVFQSEHPLEFLMKSEKHAAGLFYNSVWAMCENSRLRAHPHHSAWLATRLE